MKLVIKSIIMSAVISCGFFSLNANAMGCSKPQVVAFIIEESLKTREMDKIVSVLKSVPGIVEVTFEGDTVKVNFDHHRLDTDVITAKLAELDLEARIKI